MSCWRRMEIDVPLSGRYHRITRLCCQRATGSASPGAESLNVGASRAPTNGFPHQQPATSPCARG